MSSENLSLPTIATVVESSYGYMCILQLTLVGIKYQSLNTDLFQEHGTIMSEFLTAMIIYVAAFTVLKLRPRDNCRLPILMIVCHVSGIVANVLLLLILVNPLRCFIIIVSAILLFLALCYYYPDVYSLDNLLHKCFGWIRNFCGNVEPQREDIEMAASGAPISDVQMGESHQSADVQPVQMERYISGKVEPQREQIQMAQLGALVINVQMEESHQSTDV